MVSRITAPTGNTEWCNAIDGFTNGHLTSDADGVYTVPHRAIVDLSQALSQRLGRQMSMMSTYKVDYINIQMVNVDNVNDNDSGLVLSGKIHHWSPTDHRIDAMKLARAIEIHQEKSAIDADSYLLSTERDYKGMRLSLIHI